jgi:hypothetical protein
VIALAHEHEATPLQHILAADFVHVLPTGQFITKSEHIGYVASHPAFTDIFACREGRWQAVGAQETPLANTSR